MCLAIVALDAHPRYMLVVAANRDEFHSRPTEPAHWWRNGDGEILAGRDLEAGGTWLGVTRRGRWGFVTNVRQGTRRDLQVPSRGVLVPRVLGDRRDIHTALIDTIAEANRYNGFNLMAGDFAQASWGSNRGEEGARLERGVHGLSNASLDTPWPKLVRTKAGVAAWATRGDADIDPLLALLADRERARDDELPDTGVSREWERVLSAPFIIGKEYGTRSSTVVTISRDGDIRLVEQSFSADGAPAARAEHAFKLSST
jgi:uncharacterized protein with NRDE domain